MKEVVLTWSFFFLILFQQQEFRGLIQSEKETSLIASGARPQNPGDADEHIVEEPNN